jgi:hypothetical protein
MRLDNATCVRGTSPCLVLNSRVISSGDGIDYDGAIVGALLPGYCWRITSGYAATFTEVVSRSKA